MMQEAIVQALPARRRNEDTATHQSPSKQNTHGIPSQALQGNQCSPTPPSSRRTRSQAAPDWTVQEMLVLLNEIAAIDEDWLKELSSYQRWKMLSDSCVAMNVSRSSNQCKRKWEMLLDDYVKIRKWESLSMENSYWFLEEDRRKELGLPALFQKDVFDAMNAVIQVQKHQSESQNSDPDRIICVPEFEASNADNDSDTKNLEVKDLNPPSKSLQMKELITTSRSPTKTQASTVITTTTKIPEKAQATAGKLRGDAECVFAALRGEPQDGTTGRPSTSFDSMKATAAQSDAARRQADELIKALTGLTNSLDELCELIGGGGGCAAGIKPVNSKA